MNRAVFMDRDGTVSEEAGYIDHADRLRIYPWAPKAIRKLNMAGIRAILVTNQAGIARGYFDEELLETIHARLNETLAREGARLDAIYYCPHHPEAAIPSYRQDCDCRKPKPGMILRAAEEFALDVASSFVIGDRYRDVEMAHRAEARGILVLSGYGNAEYTDQSASWPRQPDHVAADLSEAVDWIVARI